VLIVDNLLQVVSPKSAPGRGPGAFALNDGDKKDAMFATICGLDREIEQLKSELASVNSQLSYY